MKTLRIIPVILLFAVFASCEKAVIDDSEKDKTEETIKKDDNNNKDNPGEDKSDNPDNDDKDDNDQDDDDTPIDDLPIDPGYDDKDAPYEETDINTDDDNKEGISTGDTVSVSDFLTKKISGGVNVEGYIVASCVQNIKNADFDAPFKGATALLMADDPDERNTDNVISIQLKSGSKMREELNLEDHPENKGKRLRVFGYRNTYLGITGIKDIASGMFWLLD